MQMLSRPGLATFSPQTAPISFGQQGLPNLLQMLQGLGGQQDEAESQSKDISHPLPPVLLGPREIGALLRGGGLNFGNPRGGSRYKRMFDNELSML